MKCDRVWRGARLATMAAAQPGLGIVENGLIASKDGRIVYAGAAADAPAFDAAETIDCEGRWITPGLVDCHTHIVYGGNRAHEFELRLAGASYEEIARAGGGIVSTMRATRERERRRSCSPRALRRVDALIARRRHDARDQVGLRPRPRQRDEVAARRAPAGRSRGRCRSSRPSSARTRCRPRPRATRTPISPMSANEQMPAVAKAAWPTRSMPSAKCIAFSPEQIGARLRDRARRSACR